MRKLAVTVALAAMVVSGGAYAGGNHHGSGTVSLSLTGSFASGTFGESAAEIPAYDAKSKRLFVVNADEDKVDVLDMSDPANMVRVTQIETNGSPNSVAVYRGLVAVAVEAPEKTDTGLIAFYDTDGNLLKEVPAGALPDMVTFTPDGNYVLAANEGEPNDDYTVDPEGSITIINLCRGVRHATAQTADFGAYNAKKDKLLAAGVRIFGPGATVAQDLEPEYIAVSADSRKAWVSLQENNAFAVVDIRRGKVVDILPLGYKDHSLPGNGIDASDKDDAINIANWPVFGMYMPDSIAAYSVRGRTYIVSANEGDSRDYDGFSEEARVKDLTLDPIAFPDADTLQKNGNLGRLTVTTTLGDEDNDGVYDKLYAFGGRSFSIWSSDGKQVFDSGDAFERITAEAYPYQFNSDEDDNDSFDGRSDNKGPEPEGVALAELYGKTYAFIGLERMGGVMVYDITDPYQPDFVQYLNNRDFSGDPEAGTAGDLAPEGLIVISAKDSPTHKPLLVVANEVSGTTSVYTIDFVPGTKTAHR
jgi:Choice-of-anchor I domain